MTSQYEEATQQSQTTTNNQTNSCPGVKVTILSPDCTQEVVLSNIRKLRETIAKEVKELDQKDLPENLQTEIPKLAVLLQRIERLALDSRHRKILSSLNSLVCSLEVALASLFQKKLSKEFTRQIRLDVERQVVRDEQLPIIRPIANQFFYIWHSKSVRLSVLYGLSWSFVVMFGGLFSLALFQHAVYSSNADIRSVEASIEKENKKLERLTAQSEGLTTPLRKEAVRLPTDSNEEGSEEKNALVANTKAYVRGLARDSLDQKIKDTENHILNFNAERTKIQSKRNPLQKFLSSIDSGFSKTLSLMLWVAAAGTLGSIVSILIRVIGESYDRKIYDDRLTPFFIGFFKPVIGACFGVLFLAFLNSGVVSTPLIPESSKALGTDQATKDSNSPETKAAFFLFSVAFVVGFSERLAKDTITKLEGSSGEDKESGRANNSRLVVVRVGKSMHRGNRIQPSSEFRKADIEGDRSETV